MHKGKVVAEKEEFKVIDCEVCRIKHMDPIPTENEITEFYKKKYFDLIKKGGRAPEIRRLTSGGDEASFEGKWLESTLYNDVEHILMKNLPKGAKNLFDIGCGTGDFLKYMVGMGWSGIGIEPSEYVGQVVANSELTIYNRSLEEFIAVYPEYKYAFDAITLLNVLEHVLNPIKFLQITKKFLKPHSGIICVRIPNDFNELQIHAQKKLKKDLWWIAVPDHINYFNIKSLQKLLTSLDFEIIYTATDFPMELFLLMGDKYVENPEVGHICHKRRVNFELSIPDVLRSKIYQNLAKIGIGRNCMIFAKIK